MKMEIIGPLILSLIAGLSTVLGCIFIFFKVKKIDEFIVFSLSFSMAIMTLVSLFDLIPSSLNTILNNYGLIFGILISLLTFLLGFLSIDKINKRIKYKNNLNSSSLYRIGLLSMISLMLHNFPEGIAVFMSAYTNISIGIKLCLAIMLHNIPEGIAIAVPMYYGGESRKNTIKMTMLSGLSEPLGALLSYIFLKNIISNLLLSYILIFVSGLMISLSFNDMLKEVIKYNKKIYLFIGILTGLIFFFLLSLL